jgi:hypothetical protein
MHASWLERIAPQLDQKVGLAAGLKRHKAAAPKCFACGTTVLVDARGNVVFCLNAATYL